MQGQNFTSGNIPKQLWSVAWPMMLSVFFHSLYNIVDAFWVSKLSASAIAAVSISQIVLFVMMSLAMGVSVGTAVLVGQNIGADKKDEAQRVLGQGFLLVIIAALLFTTVILSLKEHLLVLSGAVGEIYPLAIPYFTIVTTGSIFSFLMMKTSITFNAQGDNFTATKLFALSTLVNITLDPILIFGHFGFPKLGIAGAAYATLFSQFTFLAMALPIIMRPKMMVPLQLSNLRLRWESVKKVIDIGFPAALNQVLNPLGFAALMHLVSDSFSEAGAAAFSIGFRIEFFAFIPAIGFGFGAMSMIGQNIGAKKIDRVDEVLKKAVQFGAGAAFVFTLFALIFASQIIQVFTTDPEVVKYALLYFQIVPIGYVFFAIAFIEANVFQGIGRSWPGFWITFARVSISVTSASICLKWLNLPIAAVWSSIVVGSVISSSFGFLWVKKAIHAAKPIEIPSLEELESESQLTPPIG
tara:strand:- start:98121 stop:99524 length:1404 start_codon:yes stop_codon:yes gene_type:complete